MSNRYEKNKKLKYKISVMRYRFARKIGSSGRVYDLDRNLVSSGKDVYGPLTISGPIGDHQILENDGFEVLTSSSISINEDPIYEKVIEELKTSTLKEMENNPSLMEITHEREVDLNVRIISDYPELEKINPFKQVITNIRTSSGDIMVEVDYFKFHEYQKPELIDLDDYYLEKLEGNPAFEKYRDKMIDLYPPVFSEEERTSFFKFMNLEEGVMCGERGLPKREYTPFKKDVERPLHNEICKWRKKNELPPAAHKNEENDSRDCSHKNVAATFNPFEGLKLG